MTSIRIVLVKGHINELCKRAVAKGIDIFKVLKAASVNPVSHYKMNVGLLQKNDPADFIVVKDLKDFQVVATYIDGVKVAENGVSNIATSKCEVINNFNCETKNTGDFKCKAEKSAADIIVIEALDGQLITNKILVSPKIESGFYVSDIEKDILKMVVINRYKNAPVAKAFVKNFALTRGAIASSVAHDSHNIIAVGADDESLCKAVNLIIENKGGISCADTTREAV